jgi:hypothetical protein
MAVRFCLCLILRVPFLHRNLELLDFRSRVHVQQREYHSPNSRDDQMERSAQTGQRRMPQPISSACRSLPAHTAETQDEKWRFGSSRQLLQTLPDSNLAGHVWRAVDTQFPCRFARKRTALSFLYFCSVFCAVSRLNLNSWYLASPLLRSLSLSFAILLPCLSFPTFLLLPFRNV